MSGARQVEEHAKTGITELSKMDLTSISFDVEGISKEALKGASIERDYDFAVLLQQYENRAAKVSDKQLKRLHPVERLQTIRHMERCLPIVDPCDPYGAKDLQAAGVQVPDFLPSNFCHFCGGELVGAPICCSWP